MRTTPSLYSHRGNQQLKTNVRQLQDAKSILVEAALPAAGRAGTQEIEQLAV
ncbi:hypothetical protein [Geobacter sp. SVR]|uniref:hypothetical protein n=1 Tax=Geobacter sp. SVR TaxID=2495594 RepID=UPI00143F0389|nr:hypothetical protein [Geobacter sp. SVR]BCS54628.1 hypothetical protein GSVR_29360 [Geobacter sp. SVR]GCF86864.1 hypothetical protein GSbR_34640 [Geobacter sp. SVR]